MQTAPWWILGDDMKDTIKLLDVVALTVDLPEHDLWRGQVGTVVEILAHGNAFEVEFSDSDGRMYASLGLRPDQIMVLRYEPLPAYVNHSRSEESCPPS
jgi:hypothetical protein